MKKNNITDREKMFRDALHDDSALNDSWNTPSDDMFFAAMDAIDEKKEKKRGAFYWFGLASLLLLFLGGFTFSMLQFIGSEKNAEGLENQIAKYESDPVVQPIKTSVTQENTGIENAGKVKESANSGQFMDNDDIVNNEIHANIKSTEVYDYNAVVDQSIAARNITQNQAVPGDRKFADSFIAQASTNVNTGFTTAANNGSSEVAMKDITSADLQGTMSTMERDAVASSFIANRIIRLGLVDPIIDIKASLSYVEPSLFILQPRFSVYGYGGMNFTSLHMKPIVDNGYSLTKYGNDYAGYHAGLGVSQSISKRWNLRYEIHVTELHNSSVHMEDVTYDTNKEFTDDYGEELYRTHATIFSPTTQFDCDLDLKMKEQLADDELMKQVTDIDQSYTIIGLSVLPEYNIVKNTKIDFSVFGGIDVNYIQAFQQTMDMKMIHHDEIMVREQMMDEKVDQLNRYFLSASGGFSVDYNWTNRWSSGLQIGAMRSLNSIRKNTDGVSTNIFDTRISLKTSFSF